MSNIFFPNKIFQGYEGVYSKDIFGPEALKHDLQLLMDMFDPEAVFDIEQGITGGVGEEHFKFKFADEGMLAKIGGLLNGNYMTAQAIVDWVFSELMDRYTKGEIDSKTVQSFTYDSNNGVLTATYGDGKNVEVLDIDVEKIPASIGFAQEGADLYVRIINADGTYTQGDISEFVRQHDVQETNDIMPNKHTDGRTDVYSFTIKDGSITMDKLSDSLKTEIFSASTSARLAEEQARIATSQADRAEEIAEDVASDSDRVHEEMIAAVNASNSASASSAQAQGYATDSRSMASDIASKVEQATTAKDASVASATNASASEAIVKLIYDQFIRAIFDVNEDGHLIIRLDGDYESDLRRLGFATTAEMQMAVQNALDEVTDLATDTGRKLELKQNLINLYGVLKGNGNGDVSVITVDALPQEGSNNLVSSDGVHQAIKNNKAHVVSDPTPVQGSIHPVQSGGVFNALAGKQDNIEVVGVVVRTEDGSLQGISIADGVTAGNEGLVRSKDVRTAIDSKYSFDSQPTNGSDNLVRSRGIYTAIENAKNAVRVTVDTAMSGTSTNPVQNKVVDARIKAVESAKEDAITVLDAYRGGNGKSEFTPRKLTPDVGEEGFFNSLALIVEAESGFENDVKQQYVADCPSRGALELALIVPDRFDKAIPTLRTIRELFGTCRPSYETSTLVPAVRKEAFISETDYLRGDGLPTENGEVVWVYED